MLACSRVCVHVYTHAIHLFRVTQIAVSSRFPGHISVYRLLESSNVYYILRLFVCIELIKLIILFCAGGKQIKIYVTEHFSANTSRNLQPFNYFLIRLERSLYWFTCCLFSLLPVKMFCPRHNCYTVSVVENVQILSLHVENFNRLCHRDGMITLGKVSHPRP